jgi:hypothetical protein
MMFTASSSARENVVMTGITEEEWSFPSGLIGEEEVDVISTCL